MIKCIKYFTVLLAVFLGFDSYAQDSKLKTIYFFADTINIADGNRVIYSGVEGRFQFYQFFCQCVPPRKTNPSFTYDDKVNTPIIYDIKPNVGYIPWRELVNLFSDFGNNFPDKYKLVIIELLPNGKYKEVQRLSWVRLTGTVQ